MYIYYNLKVIDNNSYIMFMSILHEYIMNVENELGINLLNLQILIEESMQKWLDSEKRVRGFSQFKVDVLKWVEGHNSKGLWQASIQAVLETQIKKLLLNKHNILRTSYILLNAFCF